MTIVLFEGGKASLLLSSVKYDSEGNIKSGFVENGCWDLVIKNGEFLAKDGRCIVNRWPMPNYEVMEIPKSVKGDYNDVMQWAQNQFDKGKY